MDVDEIGSFIDCTWNTLCLQGRDLASARKKQPAVMAAKDWLVAMIVIAVLLPFHLLAKALVYKKIRGTLTMGTAVSGGGSLPSHVDKFLQVLML
jgi:long-chain acyl-CoA synthetase